MGKRNKKQQKAKDVINVEASKTEAKNVDGAEDSEKGMEHLPEEILIKILHYSAFNKNLKKVYESSDFFKNLIDGSSALKNKLVLKIHSNPTWTPEYLKQVTKANVESERQYKIAYLMIGDDPIPLNYQDVNAVLQKQTQLVDLTINIKKMRDAKNIKTILFGLEKNKSLKRLNVRVKSTKKNAEESNFIGICDFPNLQELSIKGSHNPIYSLFRSCPAVRVLELEGLQKSEDFNKAIVLIGELTNSLKSLSFVDITFEADTMVRLHSLTGLQLVSLKFQGVDLSNVSSEEFTQFILSQKQLKNLDFHGMGLTVDMMNQLGSNLHTTEIQMLRIEISQHVIMENESNLETNNWKLDNLKIFILSGVGCLKKNLMKNIFCHRNDNLKVLRINAYVELKNGLLHQIVTNFPSLMELALGPNCHIQNNDIRDIFKYQKDLKHLEFSLEKGVGLAAGIFVRKGMGNTVLPELTSISIGFNDYIGDSQIKAMTECLPNVHTVKLLSVWKKFDDETIATLVKSLPLLKKMEVPELWIVNKHLTTKSVDLIEENSRDPTKFRFCTESGKIYDTRVLRDALKHEIMDSTSN